jgi:hypothetical protein
MADQPRDPEISDEMHSLLSDTRSNSEAFSIIGTELIEVKAMLMALIDLQKSALYATGVSESELETNVRNLIEGYRKRFLAGLEGRVRDAADDL